MAGFLDRLKNACAAIGGFLIRWLELVRLLLLPCLVLIPLFQMAFVRSILVASTTNTTMAALHSACIIITGSRRWKIKKWVIIQILHTLLTTGLPLLAVGKKDLYQLLISIYIIVAFTDLFHVLHIFAMTESLDRDYVRRIIRALATLLYVLHLGACFYYILAISHNPRTKTWFGQADRNFTTRSVGSRYKTSLYFATTISFAVGFGDFHACNDNERMFTIFYMILCFITLLYLMHNIIALCGLNMIEKLAAWITRHEHQEAMNQNPAPQNPVQQGNQLDLIEGPDGN